MMTDMGEDKFFQLFVNGVPYYGKTGNANARICDIDELTDLSLLEENYGKIEPYVEKLKGMRFVDTSNGNEYELVYQNVPLLLLLQHIDYPEEMRLFLDDDAVKELAAGKEVSFLGVDEDNKDREITIKAIL